MKILGLVSLAGMMSIAGPALASENGNQHYPIGVATAADGLLPPPGMLLLLDYQQFYQATDLVDGNGNKIVPDTDFKVSVQANAPRLLYTWKKPVIGNYFTVTTGIVVPVVNVRVRGFGRQNKTFNIGDIDVETYLGHVSADHKVFWFFGLDTWLPTGKYDKNSLANPGNNYTTFSPTAAITYVPTPHWDIGATLFTEINTKNKATDYHSGANFTIDYGASYKLGADGNGFGFGIQGYYFKQVQDDKQNGLRVGPNGNKGQVFAIGPQLRYDFPFGGVIVKYQHELAVENRARGNRAWVELAIPLFGKPKQTAPVPHSGTPG
jgi:hypothetical protein